MTQIRAIDPMHMVHEPDQTQVNRSPRGNSINTRILQLQPCSKIQALLQIILLQIKHSAERESNKFFKSNHIASNQGKYNIQLHEYIYNKVIVKNEKFDKI